MCRFIYISQHAIGLINEKPNSTRFSNVFLTVHRTRTRSLVVSSVPTLTQAYTRSTSNTSTAVNTHVVQRTQQCADFPTHRLVFTCLFHPPHPHGMSKEARADGWRVSRDSLSTLQTSTTGAVHSVCGAGPVPGTTRTGNTTDTAQQNNRHGAIESGNRERAMTAKEQVTRTLVIATTRDSINPTTTTQASQRTCCAQPTASIRRSHAPATAPHLPSAQCK